MVKQYGLGILVCIEVFSIASCPAKDRQNLVLTGHPSHLFSVLLDIGLGIGLIDTKLCGVVGGCGIGCGVFGGCHKGNVCIEVDKSHIRTLLEQQLREHSIRLKLQRGSHRTPKSAASVSGGFSFRMSHWIGGLIFLFAFIMMGIFQEDVMAETLDLAEQAFDDQYLGCKRDMERKLKEDNVLDVEIGKNKKLKRALKEARDMWMIKKKDNLMGNLPAEFEDDHGIALLIYTGFIRKDFNDATKWAGKSYTSYMNDFGFKWLHFYLTSALQILQQNDLGGEYTVYGNTDHDIEVPPHCNIYVKFGHFLYTSLDEEKATVMANKSLLILNQYPGVQVENFSQYALEREVLVPGYEVFSLSAMEEEGRYRLTTTRTFCSNFNCAYINGANSKLPVQDCVNTAGANSTLLVQDCVNTAASFLRTPGPICSGLVTVLVVVVTLLSHIA
ncbi:ecto-ADP-ribosyltransferase 5-like [Dendropsophus ebraccatus]|uniref:ecto-ADP-ribosyltransferase 5-like n=1 Tax=Dendropsophus ebraccatus TaxID=150705 RepID=UPI0038313D61